MDRWRGLRARWGRLQRTERWVRRTVVGGLGSLVGLWTLELAPIGTPVWAAGHLVALAGLAGLLLGVSRRLAVR